MANTICYLWGFSVPYFC